MNNLNKQYEKPYYATEEDLDRLRAYHLGWSYARFKARDAELRAQIPVMEKIANVTSTTS